MAQLPEWPGPLGAPGSHGGEERHPTPTLTGISAAAPSAPATYMQGAEEERLCRSGFACAAHQGEQQWLYPQILDWVPDAQVPSGQDGGVVLTQDGTDQ